jgi:hypothetical protein
MTKIITLALAASSLVLASCASTKKADCGTDACCKADAKATKSVAPAHKHAKK